MQNKTSSTINLDSVIGQSDDQVAADVNGETVMMSIQQGSYFGLDEIGSRIWSLIEQPRQASDILKILLDEYEVDRKTCEQELCVFLNELFQQGLVSSKFD